MKTVGEFFNAGLEFVNGDKCSDGASDYKKEWSKCTNYGDADFYACNITKFAWRENTGVKPEFSGLVDVKFSTGATLSNYDKNLLGWNKAGAALQIIEWRPSLYQPSVAETDTKESAIHKALAVLCGDLKNLCNYSASTNKDGYILHTESSIDWPISMPSGYYFSKNKPFDDSTSFSYVCKVSEFTDYCEKMAAEEKHMDIIGQNGNDGLHYDNAAQQVESLAVNAQRPIFTRVMADANELPPIGSFVDVVGKNGVELFYGEGEVNCEVLAHVENTAVIKMGYGLGCFSSDALKASDTRTDREKAIDDALALDEYRDGLGMMSRKDFVGKLYDNGLLKC